MNYEELDQSTRDSMLKEYDAEIAQGNAYVGKNLSDEGKAAYPDLFREAIKSGDNESLFFSIQSPAYWLTTEEYVVDNKQKVRKVNPNQAAERLALTEFSTFYVLGLAKKLMIYENHRKRYWPHPGDKSLMAIPYGPGCHHLIRRVQNS